MHFITGGAYNGKRKWVKQTYQQPQVHWISAYHNEPIPDRFTETTMIIEGIEQYLKEDVKKMGAQAIRVKWRNQIDKWRIWEKEKPERIVVIIGTDLTKGIVPMEAANRIWRDASGWVFQDIAAVSKRVDMIWYGLNQQLK
jgi:adenosylcobinamide kinase / adenosylcobinamide-phosphate guanylyltransferase